MVLKDLVRGSFVDMRIHSGLKGFGEGFFHGHEDSEMVVLKELLRGSFMDMRIQKWWS